ncbi:hypothetical protein ACETIH_15365 [Microvirga arabica]|uniref:DNA-binding protein n=1 Tax=Microvirga arabica TaxID=1128671 RepID=A0ABV6Y9Z8_9HYPH
MSKQPQQHLPLIRLPIELGCLPEDTIVSAAEVALLLGWPVAMLRRREREGHGPGCLTAACGADADGYRIGDVRRWMASS